MSNYVENKKHISDDSACKNIDASKRKKNVAVVIALAAVLAVTFVILLLTVIIPNNKYKDAISLMEAGKYDDAISAFEALDGYKDSNDKITECINKKFIAMYGQESFDRFGLIEEGKYITFGEYEQDNNTSNGKEEIEWLVLDMVDGKALLISRYALDCRQYNTEYGDVTWETCTLGDWLNGDFMDAAFSDIEKALVSEVNVSGDGSTRNKMFLLSFAEANEYFTSNNDRICEATAYAQAQGAYIGDNGNCWWWLRSPDEPQTHAPAVDCIGEVYEEGYLVTYGDNAVRPAMWIDIDSLK